MLLSITQPATSVHPHAVPLVHDPHETIAAQRQGSRTSRAQLVPRDRRLRVALALLARIFFGRIDHLHRLGHRLARRRVLDRWRLGHHPHFRLDLRRSGLVGLVDPRRGSCAAQALTTRTASGSERMPPPYTSCASPIATGRPAAPIPAPRPAPLTMTIQTCPQEHPHRARPPATAPFRPAADRASRDRACPSPVPSRSSSRSR